MSIGFHEIEDSVVIIHSAGVYKQTKAFERKGFIYVAAKGGYVILRRDGRTNVPNLLWDDIELGFEPKFDAHGKMKR